MKIKVEPINVEITLEKTSKRTGICRRMYIENIKLFLYKMDNCFLLFY